MVSDEDKDKVREIIRLLQQCYPEAVHYSVSGITQHLSADASHYLDADFHIDDFECTEWAALADPASLVQGDSSTGFLSSSNTLQDILEDVQSEARRRGVLSDVD